MFVAERIDTFYGHHRVWTLPFFKLSVLTLRELTYTPSDLASGAVGAAVDVGDNAGDAGEVERPI